MQAKTRAELELLHGETLRGTEYDLAQPAELAGAEVAGAVPRRHRDELYVEDVARLQGARFRVVNQASGLRLAVGVEVEPLVFVAAESDRLPEPIPANVLGRNRGKDFVLHGLVGLGLLDLLKEREPALLPEGIAFEGGFQVPAEDDLVGKLHFARVCELPLFDLLQGAILLFAGFAHC